MNKATIISKKRGKAYGNYANQSSIAQRLKSTISSGKNWSSMPPEHRESLDMIATKISRLVNGDHSDKDTWLDIAGYANLIHNSLDGDKNEEG